MHELRLVGVHEDGRHVLLADPAGTQYRLPLDDALRAASLRDRPRLGQLQIEIEGGLRPAEVQSLIRRGLSTQQVAERAGWSVEKVRRYEGPVLAEREYIAGLARKVILGPTAGSRTRLDERVVSRLHDRGVDRESLVWDASRDQDGRWSVTATFPAGGRERAATWLFDQMARRVTPRDDEARWLSQDEVAGPIPPPHVATNANRPSTVYDVEAEGGVTAEVRRHTPGEPIDLMAAMREHSARGRRGRRRAMPAHTPGEDDPRLDALPLAELARDPAAAPPPPVARDEHPESAHLDEPAPVVEAATKSVAEQAQGEQVAVPHRHPAAGQTRLPARRGGRPSVPSWDDIMFGTRGHDIDTD